MSSGRFETHCSSASSEPGGQLKQQRGVQVERVERGWEPWRNEDHISVDYDKTTGCVVVHISNNANLAFLTKLSSTTGYKVSSVTPQQWWSTET